jgi:hypothetical protein
MLINVAETKEIIRGFVGDDIDKQDFKTIFNKELLWKSKQEPITVSAIDHINQCISLSKKYPQIQDYVFHYLENTKMDIDEILSHACVMHSSITPEMLQFLIDKGANLNQDDYSSLHWVLSNRGPILKIQ